MPPTQVDNNVLKSHHTTVLIYLADPMCSWCWGFAPVARDVARDYADIAPLHVVAGGLFPGTRAPMDDHFKAVVREHWQHVTEKTGQPFNFSFFDRPDFVYDTEPACRALVTARHFEPSSALAFLDALHAAFYRDNRDVTDPHTLGEIAAEQGFDADTFVAEMESDAARTRTHEDFALARDMGMAGLPSLLGRHNGQASMLSQGYRPLDSLQTQLDRWCKHVQSS